RSQRGGGSTSSAGAALLTSSLPEVFEHDTVLPVDLFALGSWSRFDYQHAAAEQQYHSYAPPPLHWEHLVQTRKRIMVLGKHGIGKTSLLLYEGARTARIQLQKIEAGQASFHDLCLPLYLSLPTLLHFWKNTPSSHEGYQAMIQALQVTYQLSPDFATWLASWLPDHQVFYLFDEYD